MLLNQNLLWVHTQANGLPLLACHTLPLIGIFMFHHREFRGLEIEIVESMPRLNASQTSHMSPWDFTV
jgi:hypothetical protein